MTGSLSSLDTILKRLQPVPSLAALLTFFEDTGLNAMFLDLVDEYLPDWRGEIMNCSYIGDRIAIFIREFSGRYFGIHDEWVQSIYEVTWDDDGETSLFEGIVRHIPLEVNGFSEEDYHYFQYKPRGFQMLLSLLRCPYDMPEGFSCHGMIPKHTGSLRLPLLEEMKELLGEEIVWNIPSDGWTREEIRRMVGGTKYAGLAHFVDWVEHETGCTVLDYDEETYNMDPWPWERSAVEQLARERPLADEKSKSISELEDWLEKDPARHFKELLDFLVASDKKRPKSKPRPRTLAEIYGVENAQKEAEVGPVANL